MSTHSPSAQEPYASRTRWNVWLAVRMLADLGVVVAGAMMAVYAVLADFASGGVEEGRLGALLAGAVGATVVRFVATLGEHGAKRAMELAEARAGATSVVQPGS